MKRHSFYPKKGSIGGSSGPTCRVCGEPRAAHHHRQRGYRVTFYVSAVYDESSVVSVANDARTIFARGLEPLSDSKECVASFRLVGVEEERP